MNLDDAMFFLFYFAGLAAIFMAACAVEWLYLRLRQQHRYRGWIGNC